MATLAAVTAVCDPRLRSVVLAKLQDWQRLPKSDLLSMLTPVELLLFRPQLLNDLHDEGLITISPAGDEPVLALTEAGKQWLQRGAG